MCIRDRVSTQSTGIAKKPKMSSRMLLARKVCTAPGLRRFHDSPKFVAAQSRFAAKIEDGDKVTKMSKMQQNMATHMAYTWTVPHVSTVTQIDMSAVTARRLELREEFEARGDGKLTFTHFVAHAAISALREHPSFNVSLVEPNQIIHHKNVNLSFAVATDDGGLLVPNVKGAQELSLGELAARMNKIGEVARTRKISVDELRGGTFTLTNVGVFGNLISTPLINQPQAAIMATGAIKKQPVVEEAEGEDKVVIRPMMFATLTYDHRVNDGSKSGKFFRAFRNILESEEQPKL
eukprot:TRINITY_DN20857_c0_g1_i1.p1 TRINITY_DN20857_c0_g1~~TRINITY_DN20857_c0_g1_i1.p1  ORF type:complete len:293 (+),score=70.89 TRINITY_DN20857_c0_g1_i1:78-956(+)